MIVDVANREQYEMELANMDVEDFEKENQEKKTDSESWKYLEPTDYNASQESTDNFGGRMAAIHGMKELDKAEEDKEIELKRSLRNKGKEDQKVEEMAKIRAEERDNYGMASDPNIPNPSLLHMSSLVGIELGCSIDMIDKNIEAIRKMEIARKEFYLNNIANIEDKKKKHLLAHQCRYALEMSL